MRLNKFIMVNTVQRPVQRCVMKTEDKHSEYAPNQIR